MITESPSFIKNIEQAVRTIGSTKNDEAMIPESQGLFLVKDGTPSATSRKEKLLVLYEKEIEGMKYLICRA